MARSKPIDGRHGNRSLICYHFTIAALILGCIALGLTLKGAKIAHEDLWDRLIEQEHKNDELLQSMASVRVEVVDHQLAAEKATVERDHCSDVTNTLQGKLNGATRDRDNLKSKLQETETRESEARKRAETQEKEANEQRYAAAAALKTVEELKSQLKTVQGELDAMQSKAATSEKEAENAQAAALGGGRSDDSGNSNNDGNGGSATAAQQAGVAG